MKSHLCKQCNESDPNRFQSGRYNHCMDCRNKIRNASYQKKTQVEQSESFSLGSKPETELSQYDPIYTEEQVDIDALIAEKIARYDKAIKHRDESRITTIPAGNKAIAIVHFGDPHVDDNGCDFGLLKHYVELVQQAGNGVWAGNVGDTTNNWVGRLVKLYANQNNTFVEGIALSQWLIHSMPWAYFCLGNHDHWSDGSIILKLLMKDSRIICQSDHEARLQFKFNNGVNFNMEVRHNHKGHSMYNPAHGARKSLMFDPWADLAVSGHTHEHALHVGETPDSRHRWALKVGSFKKMDSYAAEKGFHENKHGSAAVTVIDPYAPECDRVSVFWDVERGLNYLKMLRKG